MIRRLQFLVVAIVLLIAAFSTGLAFLFYIVYLGLLAVGGSYVLTRFGLADLEAGYRVDHRQGHVGDDLRTTYSISNASGLPKPWLEVYNPTDLPVPLPGGRWACDPGLSGRGSRSCPLTRRGTYRIEPMVVRTGDPFGFFEAAATVGRPDGGDRLPPCRSAAALAAAQRQPGGLALRAGADAPDHSAGDDRPALRSRRQLQPDPLALHRAPGGDPGQGVRPRADRRRLAVRGSRCRGAGRRGRHLDGRGVSPSGRLDSPRRDPGEPSSRPDFQRPQASLDSGRPGPPPATQDHAAARGCRRRRPDAPCGVAPGRPAAGCGGA